VVALTEAYQVDATGAEFTFEVLPPTPGEQWRRLVDWFSSAHCRT
jgi:hypothetical protein